jgi:hypothetical protein
VPTETEPLTLTHRHTHTHAHAHAHTRTDARTHARARVYAQGRNSHSRFRFVVNYICLIRQTPTLVLSHCSDLELYKTHENLKQTYPWLEMLLLESWRVFCVVVSLLGLWKLFLERGLWPLYFLNSFLPWIQLFLLESWLVFLFGSRCWVQSRAVGTLHRIS